VKRNCTRIDTVYLQNLTQKRKAALNRKKKNTHRERKLINFRKEKGKTEPEKKTRREEKKKGEKGSPGNALVGSEARCSGGRGGLLGGEKLAQT